MGRRLLLAAAVVALLVPLASAYAGIRPAGRIVIPRLHLATAFYNGQAPSITARGPAHYPWTAMPGEGRTVAIAGHRLTHTHPFEHLERLKRGDVVRIQYGHSPSFPRSACYRVAATQVVGPRDVRVVRDVGVDRLVLTTCTPPGTAAYRLVVTARRMKTCG